MYGHYRFILSEDKKTAVLDETIQLKASRLPESTEKLGVCTGCYFLLPNKSCRDIEERLSRNGTYCSTGRLIIWEEVQ